MNRFSLSGSSLFFINALGLTVALALNALQLTGEHLANIDSDMLYSLSLYRDIFVRDLSVSSWNFSPTPYFFPDLLLLFALFGVIDDPGIAFAAYSVIYLMALTASISLLGRVLLQGKGSFIMCWVVVAAALLAIITYGRAVDDFGMLLTNLLFPNLHGGVLPLGFLTLAFAFRFWSERPPVMIRGATWVMLIAGVFSDILLFAHFVLPCILAAVLERANQSHRFAGAKAQPVWPSWTLEFIAIGFSVPIFSALVTRLGLVNIGGGVSHLFAASVPKSVNMLWEELPRLYTLYWPFLVGILAMLVAAAFLWHRSTSPRERWMALAFGLCICLPLPQQVLNGTFAGLPSIRQLLVCFVLPLPITLLLLPKFFPALASGASRLLSVGVVAAVLILSLGDISTVTVPSLPYTERMSCIDQAAAKHGLARGLASYWPQKYVLELSRKGLLVNQVDHKMRFRNWINNPAWRTWRVGADPPTYSFVIVDSTRYRRSAEVRFGPPATAVDCSGWIVLVYPDGITPLAAKGE